MVKIFFLMEETCLYDDENNSQRGKQLIMQDKGLKPLDTFP